MNIHEKAGRVRVMVHGESYSATWRVDGPNVMISSAVGEAKAALGGLASAPASVAMEKLRQMAKAAHKPAVRPASDQARYNVREAFRRF